MLQYYGNSIDVVGHIKSRYYYYAYQSHRTVVLHAADGPV